MRIRGFRAGRLTRRPRGWMAATRIKSCRLGPGKALVSGYPSNMMNRFSTLTYVRGTGALSSTKKPPHVRHGPRKNPRRTRPPKTRKKRSLRRNRTKPPLPVLHRPHAKEVSEKSEHSHSTNQSGGKYGNGWYGYEWWNHGRSHGGDWWSRNIEGGGNETSAPDPSRWADYPIDTPRPTRDATAPKESPSPATATPVAVPEPSTFDESPQDAQLPFPQVSQPAVTTTGEPSANSPFRFEQVTVRTKTQSMEVDRPDDSRSLLALRKLALTGPPITRGDRLARQTMGNSLSLSLELYNLLVFCETDDTAPGSTAPPRIGAGPPTCALPHAPPQSP